MKAEIIAAVITAVGVIVVPLVARWAARSSATSLVAARDQALNDRTDSLFTQMGDQRDYLQKQLQRCEESSQELRRQLDQIQHTIGLWEAGRLVPEGYELVRKTG